MSSRIVAGDLPVDSPSYGKAFVYVIPCRDEDILKLGFSRDPLIRLQTLHRRYFDFFDLDRAFLIETDLVRDARLIEKRFSSTVAAHRAPAPLAVRRDAGGHTEWYRGAWTALRLLAEQLTSADGLWPLYPWVRERLLRQSDNFFEWSARVHEELDIARGQGLHDVCRRLEALIADTRDAFTAFALSVATPDSVSMQIGDHAVSADLA